MDRAMMPGKFDGGFSVRALFPERRAERDRVERIYKPFTEIVLIDDARTGCINTSLIPYVISQMSHDTRYWSDSIVTEMSGEFFRQEVKTSFKNVDGADHLLRLSVAGGGAMLSLRVEQLHAFRNYVRNFGDTLWFAKIPHLGGIQFKLSYEVRV